MFLALQAMMTIISQLSSLALLMLVPASEPTREWHIGHNVLQLLGRLHNLLRLELCCDPTLASIQASCTNGLLAHVPTVASFNGLRAAEQPTQHAIC